MKSYFLILTIVLTGSLLKAQNVYMETLSKAKFTIYPNPTSTTLNIQTTKSKNSNVKIYDAIGQLYVDEMLTNQHTSLKIQHLQSGIYFIKVDDAVQKFVKE